MSPELVARYNLPIPRYTSYPPVTAWDPGKPPTESWLREVRDVYITGGRKLSLYLHLLFCESLCTYCACNTRITTNHGVEGPYIQRILKEWAIYLEALEETPRIREIHLGGGTPTFFSPQNLDQLLEGILASSTLLNNPAMSFEAHPASTTTSHLEVLYKHGFRRISIGVQDFDANVIKLIHRHQSDEQVKAITNLSRIIGYTSINFDMIYGLPGQTLESISDTMKKVINMRPDRIAFYGYAHVPGMKPAQNSYSDKVPDNILRSELYLKGKEMLTEAGYIEVGLDHFALPGDELLTASLSGNLHRNFMGYTEHAPNVLIGLGPSSISDCGTMLMQNTRELEEWNKMVDAGSAPIVKGHTLTAEDRVLKKHIFNIMCRGEANWSNDLEECPFLESVYERLREFEALDLIKLSPTSLKVQPGGRPFLRNIGYCFDAKTLRIKSHEATAPPTT